jgi:DNA-binding MarR family transcriptional regulator
MALTTETSLRPWRLFIQAHAGLLDALEEELKRERGLSLTWWEVLLFLARAPQGLRMTELADSVLLSKSGLTRLVDRMEEAGLIERGVCPSDRRGTIVLITPRGLEEFEAARPVHLRGVEQHFMGHLSPEEVAAIESGLSKVLGSLHGGTAGDDIDCESAGTEP